MLYKRNKEKQLSDELFKNPASEYRGSPFWGWNCELDRDELLSRIDILKQMGFGGFHIHSRTGLITEYLGDDFMKLVSDCCEKAKRENMLVGLYDEDRWPSGAAGGIVTKDKRYRQRYLLMTVTPINAETDFDKAYSNGSAYYIAEFNVALNEKGELASYTKTKEMPKENETKWYVYTLTQKPDSWYNGQTYADTLSKEAIDKFIEVTYDGYKKAVGEHFGETVPTVFTDEPQFARKGTLPFADSKSDVTIPWTMYFDELFKERYGFDIIDKLPEIFWELPNREASRARYLYHEFGTQLFTDAFSANLGNWCKNNGIELTGHMLCEESLYSQASTLGEAMRAYPHYGIPGIDILCDNYEYTTAKQAQSAAHQCGREGVMSELYGVTGWDFDFRGHKAQGDWQAALGVTLRVLSVAWVTMKGDAKRDYPGSINYQSGWYKEYSYIENHFARLSTVLTRGKPIVKIGVIHPIETYWLNFGPNADTAAKRDSLDGQFHNIAEWLLSGTMDFDYICESLLAEQVGEISDTLSVGEMKYSAIVVAGCETLRGTTVDILNKFADMGGKIIFAGNAPKYADAVKSDKPSELYDKCIHCGCTKGELLEALAEERTVEVREEDGKLSDKMCYQLRQDNGCRWLFIANMKYEAESIYETGSIDLVVPKNRVITVKGEYTPIVYDTVTGDIKDIDFEIKNGNTVIYYTFFRNDSLLLKLAEPTEKKHKIQKCSKKPISVQYIKDTVDYRLSEPNVMILDIAEYCVDNEPMREEEEVRKIQYTVREELGFENGRMQPWAMPSEAMRHTVTLRYKFFSEFDIYGARLALEDASVSEIVFNGEKISSETDGYFTDKAIETVKLPCIKNGENILEITQPTGNRSTIEACFILGDFKVKLEGIKKRLVPPSKQLGFGDVVMQGLPFYGADIDYCTDIETPCDCSAVIAVRNYRGALMRVSLDGKDLGIIAYAPYEVKADNLKKGKHRLKITLYGTRNNCFGALHNTDDKLRWIGPEAWKFMHDGKDRWEYEYSLKPMGILASPEIKYYKECNI